MPQVIPAVVSWVGANAATVAATAASTAATAAASRGGRKATAPQALQAAKDPVRDIFRNANPGSRSFVPPAGGAGALGARSTLLGQ